MFNFKKSFVMSLCASCIIFLCINSQGIISSVKSSLSLCVSTVIPSLFPFMVISQIFVANVDERMLKFLSPVLKRLFGIGPSSAAALICGLVCGYPVGARCTAHLYRAKSISSSEAESLIAYSNNSGPLFVIGAVGVGMLGSLKAGILLYCIQFFSAFSCALIFKRHTVALSAKHQNSDVNTLGLTDAICTSALNMLNICGFIVFFSVVNCILEPFYEILPDYIKYFAICIPEVTNAVYKISNAQMPKEIMLSLISLALGWSGFCVHMQVKSIVHTLCVSMKKYYAARCFIGIYSMIITYLISSNTDNIVLFVCSHRTLTAFLLFVIAYVLILYTKKEGENSPSFYQSKI